MRIGIQNFNLPKHLNFSLHFAITVHSTCHVYEIRSHYKYLSIAAGRILPTPSLGVCV